MTCSILWRARFLDMAGSAVAFPAIVFLDHLGSFRTDLSQSESTLLGQTPGSADERKTQTPTMLEIRAGVAKYSPRQELFGTVVDSDVEGFVDWFNIADASADID